MDFNKSIIFMQGTGSDDTSQKSEVLKGICAKLCCLQFYDSINKYILYILYLLICFIAIFVFYVCMFEPGIIPSALLLAFICILLYLSIRYAIIKIFESCISTLSDNIRMLQPDLIIGSSFGAAILIRALQLGVWNGNSIIFATPHGLFNKWFMLFPQPSVCNNFDSKIMIVHGINDNTCNHADSQTLLTCYNSDKVKLDSVIDDHKLSLSFTRCNLIKYITFILN